MTLSSRLEEAEPDHRIFRRNASTGNSTNALAISALRERNGSPSHGRRIQFDWPSRHAHRSRLRSARSIIDPITEGANGAIDKSSFDSANNGYRADFAHTVAATAKKYGEVSVYWDNGANGQYGFGLFDRRSYTVTQPGIVNAIMSGVGQ
ncbi:MULTISPECIES: hypothetical protein [Streptomyces]|jgi:hypothetical protein|uniref:hypothetical protein n=1 Tax=Streptomyces TaxID=1883 RepID=UPI000A582457|nr:MULTISPECIES: hypothetical protein [Streptomyces]MDI5907493.1 hypothetical protein [Streptomyces sp. 12257]